MQTHQSSVKTPANNNQMLDQNTDHIRVSVRIKPVTESSIQNQQSSPQLHILNDKTITDASASTFFHFDRVFDSKTTTESIFEAEIQPMIMSAVKGQNITILAYGQTNSGKTFSISGNQQSPGLISLSTDELFKQLDFFSSQNEAPDYKVNIGVSFLEIYNEYVNDLLDPQKRNLEVREKQSGDVVVEKLTKKQVYNSGQIMQIMNQGEQIRMIAETKGNKNSSRSHTIFSVFLEIHKFESGKVVIRTSQINLVDLAGSEGASTIQSQGLRLREGGNINKSLLALSNVICKLSTRSKKGNLYVNFRDSKLTRILQNSLMGQSQTAILCCISQLAQNMQETLQTLYFGSKAKEIRTFARINEITKESPQQVISKLKQMQRLIDHQKNQIAVKDQQIFRANEEAKLLASLGPLKSLVERLETQLHEKTENLVEAELLNQRLKSTITELTKQKSEIEDQLQTANEISKTQQKMYEAAVNQKSTHKNDNNSALKLENAQLTNSKISQVVPNIFMSDNDFQGESLHLLLQNANKQIDEDEKVKKSLNTRINQLEWENRRQSAQLQKIQRQNAGLTQQVHMQKQTTDELFKELDISLIQHLESGSSPFDISRLSNVSNRRAGESQPIIKVLEEQVNQLIAERNELIENKQEIVIEQQQQLDQLALIQVQRDKDVQEVYCQIDEMYEEIQNLEMIVQEKDDVINEFKEELNKAQLEIIRLNQSESKKRPLQSDQQPFNFRKMIGLGSK